MKAFISTKALTLIAALAVSAGASATSHAADARTVNSYNEGSEPQFLQSATDGADQRTQPLVKSENRTKVSAAPKEMSSGFFGKWDAEVMQRATSPSNAKALNSVNEGQVILPYGQ